MTEVLHTPSKERVVTTNAWAFLHWLRMVQQVQVTDWGELQRWSASDPNAFAATIARFAGLSASPLRLARHEGPHEGLVLRPRQAARFVLTRQECLAPTPHLRPDIATFLARDWPAQALIRPVAELLLHTDVRPNDRLLVSGNPWPWIAALLEGTTVIVASSSDLLDTAEAERATILVASAGILANTAFPRPGRRNQLGELRSIIATGGPLSPEGRRRVYTWVKADVMLLARSGDTFWGNPLEPVLAQPIGTPTFLTPPAATPARR
jgi:hypothetical protein